MPIITKDDTYTLGDYRAMRKYNKIHKDFEQRKVFKHSVKNKVIFIMYFVYFIVFIGIMTILMIK